MQPPEEQQLKPAEINSETPLLVLEPCKFKAICKMVFGLVVFYVFFKSTWKLFESDWKHIGFGEVFEIFCYGYLFFCIVSIIKEGINGLLTKSFKLYADRAEKETFFGKKVVCLKNTQVKTTIIDSSLYVKSSERALKYDLRLGDDPDTDVKNVSSYVINEK